MPAKSRPWRCGVVVRVGVDREARTFEQRAVILPARVADPHLRTRREAAQEVGADLEPAGAAQRLDGHRASRSRPRRRSAPKSSARTSRS